jgi:hypothetical protein
LIVAFWPIEASRAGINGSNTSLRKSVLNIKIFDEGLLEKFEVQAMAEA